MTTGNDREHHGRGDARPGGQNGGQDGNRQDGRHPDAGHGNREDFADQVRRKAERMAAARRRREDVWRHLVHVGVLGWVFVLPVVAGAIAGRLLARWTGISALALIGLLLGLAIGCYTAWREIRHSMTEEDQ